MKEFLIPRENEIDVKELSSKVTEGLNIIPVDKIEDAIPYIFQDNKKPSVPKRKTISKKSVKRK